MADQEAGINTRHHIQTLAGTESTSPFSVDAASLDGSAFRLRCSNE